MAGQVQVCPQNSLQGYPVSTTLTLTDTLLTTLYEQIILSPRWGIRTTVPIFVGSSSQIDEDTLTNSLVYNKNTYTLLSIQFQPASHKTFVYPPSNQVNNVEDIIITYGLDAYTESASPIISIIIPIIRTGTDVNTDPLYLQAFGNADFAGEALTIETIVPKTTYMHYNACISSFNLNFTVIVSMNGLNVTTTTMKRIFNLFTKLNSAATAYQIYLPPTMRYPPAPYVIRDQLDMGLKIRTSNNIVDMSLPQVIPLENETTDAYKCVPLDPESQVHNGKIIVDPNNGEILSSVLNVRKQEIAVAKSKAPKGFYAAQFSASLATLIGVSLVIIFGLIVVIFIFGRFGYSIQHTLIHSGGFKVVVFAVLIFVAAFLIGRFTVAPAAAAAAAPATAPVKVAPATSTAALAAAQKAAASALAAAATTLTPGAAQVTAAGTAATDAATSATAADNASAALAAVDTAAGAKTPSAATTAANTATSDAKAASTLAASASTAVNAANTACPTLAAGASPSAACTTATAAATAALNAATTAAQTASASAAAAVKAATPGA